MKKTILLIAALGFVSVIYAQNEKYTSAMKANIAQLDSMMAKNNYADLANSFTRIGDAEKTQWLPYYYAAYCTAVQAFTEKDGSKKDGMADNAAQLISKAEGILGKENSETDVIKSMIATIHMTVDPQTRYMTYVPQINDNLERAKQLDPTNPRPYLLEAQNKFYTPEAYGGGKDAAKVLFDKAKQLADNFKPETEISPDWGKTSLEYFLSQYK